MISKNKVCQYQSLVLIAASTHLREEFDLTHSNLECLFCAGGAGTNDTSAKKRAATGKRKTSEDSYGQFSDDSDATSVRLMFGCYKVYHSAKKSNKDGKQTAIGSLKNDGIHPT